MESKICKIKDRQKDAKYRVVNYDIKVIEFHMISYFYQYWQNELLSNVSFNAPTEDQLVKLE